MRTPRAVVLGFIVMTYRDAGARVVRSCGEGVSRFVLSVLTFSKNKWY